MIKRIIIAILLKIIDITMWMLLVPALWSAATILHIRQHKKHNRLFAGRAS